MLFQDEILNNKYENYLEKHKEEIRIMEQKAQKVLGREYDLLYDFFVMFWK